MTHPAPNQSISTIYQLRNADFVTTYADRRLTYSSDYEMDNLIRAGKVARAVLCFADSNFSGGNAEDFGTVIGDLLGDLHHLADAVGEDFNEWLERGINHYEDERRGEG